MTGTAAKTRRPLSGKKARTTKQAPAPAKRAHKARPAKTTAKGAAKAPARKAASARPAKKVAAKPAAVAKPALAPSKPLATPGAAPAKRPALSPGQLRLDRFCGHERFPVANVKVYQTDREGARFLNLEIICGKAVEQSVPEEEKSPEPSLEVWIPIPATAPAALVGSTVKVPWSHHETHDFWNYLCSYEQEDVWDVSVEFAEIRGNECRARITGTTRDPNHYDGSKSDTKVDAEIWFTFSDG